MNEEDLNDRVQECLEDDACEIRGIEVNFHIPVYMTQEQQRKLNNVVTEIINHPYNQPKGGVHWLCGIGAKLIMSDVDSALTQRAPTDDPRKPENGEEPVHDDTVHCLDSFARPFISDKERNLVLAERAEKR